MRINALLASIQQVRSGAFPGLTPPAVPAAGLSNGAPLAPDTFEQGQDWKNRAASSAVGQSTTCSCGTCRACAAKAYTKQAGTPVSPNASATADANQAQKEGDDTPIESGMGPKGPTGEPLTQAEQLELAQLDQIDTRVRAHEMAHLAAAGAHARSGAQFQYAKGPDGKQYAVGGEVSIDTSEESSPEATISKMQTVRAAALAPADPSPQDRKVAAKAAMLITKASQELQMIRLEQQKTAVETERQGAQSPSGTESAAASAVPIEEQAARPGKSFARQLRTYMTTVTSRPTSAPPRFQLAV